MQHVLIVGASGELGSALAAACAPTAGRLTLWGRDQQRLARAASLCRTNGAPCVAVRTVDLLDPDSALSALRIADDEAPVDMVIFASGQGDIRPAGASFESAALVSRLHRVNMVGPSVLAAEVAERMAVRKTGRIVFVGSAAAFAPLPFAAAYASSKAGLARYADALRIAMRPHGVSVTLVSPGFIDTAAGRRVAGPRPFLITPERAASAILVAAHKRKGHVIVPWPFAVVRLLLRVMPAFLQDRLLRALTPPDL